MRILVISNLYPPNVVGGYERLCFQVASALAERGHEIHVLTSDFGGREQSWPGQSIDRSLRLLADSRDIYAPFEAAPAERASINAHNIEAVTRTVARVAPDVIFVWNLYFFDASLQEALARAPAPSVFFLTDNWLIAARRPDRIGDFFQRHVHGREPFIPSDTQPEQVLPHTAIYGADFVRQLYHSCGFAFQDEFVVHNGVSPPVRDESLALDRSALVRPGELRLLFAGRLVDIKGPQDCVAALPLIQRAVGPDLRVTLTLVGDRTDAAFHERLERQIGESGCADAIRLAPPVSEHELTDLFNAHDVYLFPSHYEPFALTLILAMAAGIPVVASSAGGNPEIVLPGRTGMLYEKGDVNGLASAVAALAETPHLRQKLAERGMRFGRRFTFARMVERIEQVLSAKAGSRRAA